MNKKLEHMDNKVIIGDISYDDDIDGKCISFDKLSNDLYIAEHFNNNLMNGMVYHAINKVKSGELILVENNTPYGPSLHFENENYTEFRFVNEEGNGYQITVGYDNGAYLITELIANQKVLRALQYIDGNLNHLLISPNGDIYEATRLMNLGDNYKFLACRMFSMDFDVTRSYITKSGYDNLGANESIYQILTNSKPISWGYGITEWNDGSFYMGEYYDGYRTGIGFLQFENGDKYMGKFYENKISGNGMLINDENILFGNWKQGKKHGIIFEVYQNAVIINRYDNDRLVGYRYQFSMGEENIAEF